MHSKSKISNFKLLVILPNNTEADKRDSATENLLLLKSKTTFHAQTIWRYILVDVFQLQITPSFEILRY